MVKFFNGGVSYETLMNKPLHEIFKIKTDADYLIQCEKAEMEKRR